VRIGVLLRLVFVIQDNFRHTGKTTIAGESSLLYFRIGICTLERVC
jgi:hypothetical protein